MDVNSDDWTAAKGLLVLLAQTLSAESAGGGILAFDGISTVAERVLNRPVYLPVERIPHPVHLISTLRQAQTQIAQWIERLPPERGEEPKRREEPVAFSFNRKEAPLSPVLRPDAGPIGGKEIPLFPKSGRKTEEPLVARQEKGVFPQSTQAALPEAPSERLAGKTGKLIEAVRSAIQTLSTSSFIEQPQSAPLRAVLSKLKPLVDECVEALSQNNLDPHQEGSFTPFQPQVPLPPKSAKSAHKMPTPFLHERAETAPSPPSCPPLKPLPRHENHPMPSFPGPSPKRTDTPFPDRKLAELESGFPPKAPTPESSTLPLAKSPFSKKENQSFELNKEPPAGKRQSIPETSPIESPKRPILEESREFKTAIQKGEGNAIVPDQATKLLPLPVNPPIFFAREVSGVKPTKEKGRPQVERPLTPNALPASPFPPSIRPLSPSLKKKKQKRYFFKDPDEDEAK